MTAPTHAAFGILCAALAGTGNANAAACALGALLPDIDHPQSAIGRIFFFLSHPINARFGHRQLIHSFIVWFPLIVIGFIFHIPLLTWAGIGAFSHIIIDSYTVSGVQAFLPFTERSMVFFKRDWRIYTSSVHEIFVFVVIAVFISMANYSYALGGPRKLINMLVKSHQITVEEYARAGLKYCDIEGKFRWADGRIENVTWPVVGAEKQKLVYWNNEKVIRDDKQGKFLRSVLKQNETDWPIVHVAGFCIVEQDSFWFDGKKWRFAKKGDTVFGSVKTVSRGFPRLKTAEDSVTKLLE